MEKVYTKDGRKFIIRYEKRNVYIGTVGYLSDLAAQLVCHQMMEPLNWEPNQKFANMVIDDHIVVGVGYKVPIFTDPIRSIEKLF